MPIMLSAEGKKYNIPKEMIEEAQKDGLTLEKTALAPIKSNDLWSKGEEYLQKGLEYAAPVLTPLGAISQKGSELVRGAIGSTLPGMIAEKGKGMIAEVIPESVKSASLSQALPQLYSETGERMQLQRGGALDPTVAGTYKGLEEMATDPLNLLPMAGGVTKAVKGLGKAGLKAAGEIAETTGGMLTGVPKNVIKNYKKFAPQIEEMKISGVEGIATDLQKSVADTIKEKISQKGSEIGETISNMGGTLNLAKIRQPFDEAIAKAEATAIKNPTPINKRKIENLKTIRSDLYAENMNTLDPVTGFELQQDLKTLMDFRDKATLEGRYAGLTQNEKAIKNAADKAYAAINDQYDSLTTGISSKLKNDYKKLIETRKKLEPIAGDAQKTLNSLKTLKRKDKAVLRNEIKNIDKELGTNINDSVDLLETYAYLGEPSFNPLSGGGVTSTTRTILAGLLGSAAGGGINPATAAMAAGAASPAMMKQVLNAGLAAKRFGQATGEIASSLPRLNLPTLSPAQQLALYQGLSSAGNQYGQ